MRHCARRALGEPGLSQVVVLSGERRHHRSGRRTGRARQNGRSAVCWDRVLFCAKETVYKAWFLVPHRWLGLEHASVTN
jgi:4'-phosphopantetheinyl transferase EntD